MDLIDKLARLGVNGLALIVLIAKGIDPSVFIEQQAGIHRGPASPSSIRDEEVAHALHHYGGLKVKWSGTFGQFEGKAKDCFRVGSSPSLDAALCFDSLGEFNLIAGCRRRSRAGSAATGARTAAAAHAAVRHASPRPAKQTSAGVRPDSAKCGRAWL